MFETDKSTRLVRAARWLRGTLWAASALTLAATAKALVAAWQGIEPVGVSLHTGGLPMRWAGLLAALQALLVAAAIFELTRMLGQIRIDQLFPPRAGRHFGRFAVLLLVAVLVHGPLSALLLAWLAPHAGGLSIDLDTADLVAILVAAALALVARLLDAAARLEEDQRSIV